MMGNRGLYKPKDGNVKKLLVYLTKVELPTNNIINKKIKNKNDKNDK